MNGPAPVVIGHRGAPGYRPEHTLASYLLAIEMGVDHVELDLVPTRDGALVARHESEISRTTDVAARPEFARRRTTKLVDGQEASGWFTEDFTLAELKTLRAVERWPRVRPANTWYDGHFEVPTLDEVLSLVEEAGRRRGVLVGVYLELKDPARFEAMGLPLQAPLVETLRRRHLDRPNAPVLVESFEAPVLKELAGTVGVPLLQLLDVAAAPTPSGVAAPGLQPADLADIATYACGIGVEKDLLLPDGTGADPGPSLVGAAHEKGLLVHAWTLRSENRYLHPAHRRGPGVQAHGDLVGEAAALLRSGVDGLVTDHPDRAVEARRRWLARRAGRVAVGASG